MTLLDKQMDLFTRQSLMELVSEVQGPCISIYMPTERKGLETQQGPIRLKNLLNQADQALAARGERMADIQDLLAPARALADNNAFWQAQSDGLALLLAPDLLATYRLPLQFQETTLVNDRFYLKPLLPLLSGDGTFYVLALRQGGVRLLQGSRFSLAEVELSEDTPKSLAEVLKYDEFETTLRFHIASRPSTGGGRGAAMYQGQGGATDDANMKEQVVRFFRQLDNGVRDLLEGGTHPPLVLAGIDYLRGLYRQVNQYSALVEAEITTDPEALAMSELHERAWTLVEPIFTSARTVAMDAYHHLAGNEDARAAHTIAEIVPAAYFQRVDTLFAPQNVSLWGVFHPEDNRVQLHEAYQPGDEDLVDFAAVHTLLNGGSVYIGEPVGETVAAILRY